MAEPEPRRFLTREAADVDLQSSNVSDDRQNTQYIRSRPMLNSPPPLPAQLMNFQRNSGHETGLGQMDNDSHGAAAMALTALSSGMGITSTAKPSLKATQSHLSAASGTMVGLGLEMTEGTATASRNLLESSSSATVARMSHSDNKAQTVQLNERRILTKASGERGAVAVAVAGLMQSRQQTVIEHSQPQPTCEPPLPESETIPLHFASHVPGERMQTLQLSHLLKDQLSLASMRSDQSEERDRAGSGRYSLPRHDDVVSKTYEEDGRSPAHNSREDSARMYTEHRLYRQSISSPNLRLLIEETRQSDDVRYQRGTIEHTPLAEWQQPTRQYENSYSPKGIRPLDQNSTSTLTELETVKPKRKYTKKTTASPSLLENPNQEASHAAQEGELLQSDRGLILRTQIPKKGRPISKHSSTSQSATALSSLGVLPASHPYFNSKTGISPSSSAHSFRPPDSNRSPLANYPRNPGYPPPTATTADESQPHAPIRRRPGRPPLASTIARHAHTQSHSSLQPGPFSVSKSQSLSAKYSHRDVHGRPPPPLSAPSPSTSVDIPTVKFRHNRHSYPSSQGHEQLPVLESEHRIAAHQTEDRRFQNSHNGETLPSPGPASFAGGIPTQTNGREGGSYGAEKRQSMDDLYCLENERRGTSSVYDIKERQDEHYQDHAKGRCSKRRLSISDMDSIGSETNTRDGNETVQGWLDYGSEYRPRPRSLILTRGISDSLLQLQSVTARTTDAACISELRHRTSGVDDDREMSEHRDSEMPITRDATRRSLHSHTRSLDLSSRSLFSLDRHPQPLTERAPESQSKPDHQAFGRSNSDSNIYSCSPSPPPLLTRVQYGKDYSTATNTQLYPSGSIDYQGHSLELSETTRADDLAREMSAGSSGGSKSRTGTISAQTKTSSKRLSKRGPGPYLKKHQILQMQLQQMQREQEEMEAQLVSQQQQELYQLQQRYSLESSRPRQYRHSRHTSMDQEFYSQHHQQQPQLGRPLKQRALMRSENASFGLHSHHYPTRSVSQGHSQTPPPLQPQQSSQPRQRQNYQQPILQRPISLPSLTDPGSSSSHCSQPPPGQPMYRSLHAPYLVSPSSLVSVGSSGSTGTGSTLHTAGGRGTQSPLDGESSPQAPSPTIDSSAISQPTTPPSRGLSFHSPPYSQQDLHGYFSSQQVYDIHRPIQQRGNTGGNLSRSSSRSEMSNSSSNSTLVHSNSQQHLHRHSASLPAIHYSPSQQQQQHYGADSIRPPAHRFPGSTDAPGKKLSSPSTIPPHSSPYHNATLPPRASENMLMDTAEDDGCIQGLSIRTPPSHI